MKLIAVLSILLLGLGAKAQTTELTVKTKVYCNHCAVCESCGEKFETELSYVKGIKSARYNESDTTIIVKYKANKITPERIRKEISLLGFDADDVPAEPKAAMNLDACCRKPE